MPQGQGNVAKQNWCDGIFKKYFIYLKEKERDRESRAQGQREGATQADSALSLDPHVGLNLMTLRSDPSLNEESDI